MAWSAEYKAAWTAKRWSPENKKRAAKKAKAQWRDPIKRKKALAGANASRELQRAGVKRKWAEPGFRERVVESQLVAQNKPETVARRKVSLTQHHAEHPEHAKKTSRVMKRVWKDPEFQAKMHTPEMRKKTGMSLKSKWEESEFRTHQTAERKARANTSAEKKRLKAIIQAVWDDPEKRKAMIAKRKPSYANRVIWNKGLTKHTDARLMNSSVSQRGKIPQYGKMRAQYQKNKRKILMRSKWEVAFAQYLDRRKIDWEYESKCFNVGRGIWAGETYTPDFYLPRYDMHVEVKGWYNKTTVAKYKKFCELYPNVKWKLFDREKLRKLSVIDFHGRAQLEA